MKSYEEENGKNGGLEPSVAAKNHRYSANKERKEKGRTKKKNERILDS
jgi:hypothetical protein